VKEYIMTNKIKISKEEINELPLYRFNGSIKLIDSKEEALKAIEALKGETLLGFDTESRPAFKKGESYDISLLQLATSTHAYLFRLNKIPVIQGLVDILTDPNIVKTGVGIQDDVKGLKKLFPFEEKNFVDLAKIAQEKRIVNFGLRALTAICLKKRLSKSTKISNWERQVLTPAQLHYAACDAVVGFEIYGELCD
jgi:ribonuclease D